MAVVLKKDQTITGLQSELKAVTTSLSAIQDERKREKAEVFVDGAINRDYTLVMGALIIYATLIVIFNLVADVLYALLDPKVKYD